MKLFSRKKESQKKEEPRPTAVEKVLPETTILTSPNMLIRPRLSEKASILEANRTYIFEVTRQATKPEVKKAVERTFGVKVLKVNLLNKKTKHRFWRGRVGSQPGFKKALVTLAEGKKIEVIPK